MPGRERGGRNRGRPARAGRRPDAPTAHGRGSSSSGRATQAPATAGGDRTSTSAARALIGREAVGSGCGSRTCWLRVRRCESMPRPAMPRRGARAVPRCRGGCTAGTSGDCSTVRSRAARPCCTRGYGGCSAPSTACARRIFAEQVDGLTVTHSWHRTEARWTLPALAVRRPYCWTPRAMPLAALTVRLSSAWRRGMPASADAGGVPALGRTAGAPRRWGWGAGAGGLWRTRPHNGTLHDYRGLTVSGHARADAVDIDDHAELQFGVGGSSDADARNGDFLEYVG
jgi:hypothetical protein